jgi:hypothetical protein
VLRNKPFDTRVVDNLLSLFDGYRLKHKPNKQEVGSKDAALELLRRLENEITRW